MLYSLVLGLLTFLGLERYLCEWKVAIFIFAMFLNFAFSVGHLLNAFLLVWVYYFARALLSSKWPKFVEFIKLSFKIFFFTAFALCLAAAFIFLQALVLLGNSRLAVDHLTTLFCSIYNHTDMLGGYLIYSRAEADCIIGCIAFILVLFALVFKCPKQMRDRRLALIFVILTIFFDLDLRDDL